MPHQMRKNHNENGPVAFRTPAVARSQINDLMRLWGENQTQVVLRCIERVWSAEVGVTEAMTQIE